jgi:hypothetical protein
MRHIVVLPTFRRTPPNGRRFDCLVALVAGDANNKLIQTEAARLNGFGIEIAQSV